MYIHRRGHIIIVFCAVVILLSILLFLLNNGSIFAIPGDILFRSFHIASFFIPLHIILLLFVRNNELYWWYIMAWASFVIPFVTLALSIRIIIWQAPTNSLIIDSMVLYFGKIPSFAITTSLLIGEIVTLFRIFRKEIVQDVENTEQNSGLHTSLMPETFRLRYTGNDVLASDTTVNEIEDGSSRGIVEQNETLQHHLSPIYVDDLSEEKTFESPGVIHLSDIPTVPRIQEGGAEIHDAEIIHVENENFSADIEEHAGSEDETALVPIAEHHYAEKNLILEDIFIVGDAGRQYNEDDSERMKNQLRETLEEFGINVEVTGIRHGSSITCFEVLPSPGIRLTRISNLADNIALRLAAESIRIVSPIPGKHAVGIEIPNRERDIVRFGNIVKDQIFQQSNCTVPIVLGEDISGEKIVFDLTMTPHILIAGATGSGKSVCVNTIICSIISHCAPEQVKLLLIDPKIVELKLYNDVPHLLTPVITQSSRVFQALQYCIYEMEHRYNQLESLGVRNIASYNTKLKELGRKKDILPYIVVIIDEFADLMASTGKELESVVARLAAMSRAVGIHLVLATQRPSTDVITGLIKANIPSRIAFMVASKVDSRIILDTSGAEKLLGRGDMLFSSSWHPFPTRIQGAFLSEDEMERLVDYVRSTGKPEYIDDEIFLDEEENNVHSIYDDGGDPLLQDALNIVRCSHKASASYLQRRLKIGYNRAARLIEILEERGVVGPPNGSKARDVLIKDS